MQEMESIFWKRLIDLEMGFLQPVKFGGIEGEASKMMTQSLQDLFFSLSSRIKVDAFFEIGALWAEASRKFVNLPGFSGPVFAAEAHPESYAKANSKYNFETKGITYLHTAIGIESTEVEIFVPLKNGMEGISMASLNRVKNQSRAFNEYKVPCITLNEFGTMASSHSNFENCALWIDVEGSGIDVLRSGLKVLEKTGIIYMEVEDGEVWVNASTSTDVIELLLEHQFIPVARDHQHPQVWNLLLIKKEFYNRELAFITKELKNDRRKIRDYLISYKVSDSI